MNWKLEHKIIELNNNLDIVFSEKTRNLEFAVLVEAMAFLWLFQNESATFGSLCDRLNNNVKPMEIVTWFLREENK